MSSICSQRSCNADGVVDAGDSWGIVEVASSKVVTRNSYSVILMALFNGDSNGAAASSSSYAVHHKEDDYDDDDDGNDYDDDDSSGSVVVEIRLWRLHAGQLTPQWRTDYNHNAVVASLWGV